MAVGDIRAVLGLDRRLVLISSVGKYGLDNAVFLIGETFQFHCLNHRRPVAGQAWRRTAATW